MLASLGRDDVDTVAGVVVVQRRDLEDQHALGQHRARGQSQPGIIISVPFHFARSRVEHDGLGLFPTANAPLNERDDVSIGDDVSRFGRSDSPSDAETGHNRRTSRWDVDPHASLHHDLSGALYP